MPDFRAVTAGGFGGKEITCGAVCSKKRNAVRRRTPGRYLRLCREVQLKSFSGFIRNRYQCDGLCLPVLRKLPVALKIFCGGNFLADCRTLSG